MKYKITPRKIIKWILPYGFVKKYMEYKNKMNEVIEPHINAINYQVNNYCNSKCVMCNVWQQKDFRYMDIQEFEKVLGDSLFNNVEHIGITGGEPSLIANLPDYFEVSIRQLKNLKGLSVITNSLATEQIKKQIEAINLTCLLNNKEFSVMLSLDGLDKIHDNNRGIEGSYEKVLNMLEWLKDKRISVLTGTTITKNNVWNLDELLFFLMNNNIYGRFRVAEFIKRLYNDLKDNTYIRNFDDDEIYQLLLFFSKLEFKYEKDPIIINTYRNIKHMLQGGKRLIECPYKNRQAINLNCHGEIAYCAPKSPIIGSITKESGIKIYIKNRKVLRDIQEKYCDNCIHDYHSEPSAKLLEIYANEKKYRELISINSYNNHKNSYKVEGHIETISNYSILIVGWYGTETVGDKAILGGIVDSYINNYGNDIKIYISSLYPFVTERTIKELNINAIVIPVYSEQYLKYSSMVDEVVVGGGPLMELDELSLIEWAFKIAKDNSSKTTILGCGIGPIYTGEKREAVREILTLADKIYLRDSKSIEQAEQLIGRSKLLLKIDDPACKYINKISEDIIVEKEHQKLACFLRELTYEYRADMNYEEFIKFKNDFEEGLASNIIYMCDKMNMIPYFYAMHNFVIGNDDRDFNIEFTSKYFKNREYYVEKRLSTVENTIEAMKSSKFNLCMRFHSVVFSDNINSNYIAIDYTTGGKIKSYLDEKKKINRMIRMKDILGRKEALSDLLDI
ncbi:antilisterial bacteriocin subtilosin biosynthesis protein AlbA [Oxobacter pfennigii]|uniref:Antilisterial bacteriocin subtilosin biosynthesis protein AlbA n=1 Tax=Oxobacter pfennigii TaxID=36849 RepID=A0A0P8Y9U7_9CLOT|nr:polysaccharide pyruvyl transferase family protein [Oxobacter pfennigii]KPU43682.1 antilisterial bacteriocin subtilosin biosynthesis protein AlbA [Oxobacter pfennigii]